MFIFRKIKYIWYYNFIIKYITKLYTTTLTSPYNTIIAIFIG